MKKIIILAFFIVPTISACLSPATPSFTITNDSTKPIETTTPKVEISNNAPHTPTSTGSSLVTQNCLNVQDKLPNYDILKGTLVLNSKLLGPFETEGEIGLMDMASLDVRLMSNEEVSINAVPTIYNISPDQKRYFYFSADKWLNIKTVDGQEYSSAYWDPTWGEAVEWFDNERLVIRPKDELNNNILVIVNPLTGEWKKVQNKFPSGLNVTFPLFDYNSTLTRGSYISGDNFVLWDVQTNADIWKGLFFLKSAYQWRRPERDKVALAVTSGDFIKPLFSELFVLDQDGQANQFTHLTEAYPTMQRIEITNINWSPNGRYIAFSLYLDNETDELKTPTLFVVDTETKQVTDFCIVVAEYSPIVWSPDSQKIVVTSPIDYEEYQKTIHTPVKQQGEVILVDIIHNYATRIIDDTVGVGWIVSP